MPSKCWIALLIVLLSTNVIAQQTTQNIKGVVLDNASYQTIPFATIVLNPLKLVTSTDSLGNFYLANIPVGNYTLNVSALGYEPLLINEILITSAKENFVKIHLKEKVTILSEVIIKPQLNKETPLNPLALVSAKMLSVEEASRFAGGFDDPARLVSTFAGISSNIGNNGISVRGNNPKYLQWKFEGIEITNPNHFADNAVFGGGVLSALSKHNLDNSDFISSAFPAEYSNALSGVFDMNIRKGNDFKKERTIQLGLTGLDYAEEGPFKKEGKATYIFNYRYSTLSLLKSLLPEDGGKGVNYQDLSFKLNFPTKQSGTFSAFGIGLKDFTGLYAKKDTTKWETISDKQSQNISFFMGTFGVSHQYFINKKTFIKTILANTSNGIDFSIDELQKNGNFNPYSKVKSQFSNFILSSTINTKANAKYHSKSGFTITRMGYRLSLNQKGENIVDENGSQFLVSAYSNSTYNFSNQITLNFGLNSQLFTLNQHYTIEPRLGIKYQFKPNQTLSFGYGLHSRLEKLNYYFAKNSSIGNGAINKNLDFTKAHHLVLGYGVNFAENLYLKVESYYQYLFDVPVIKDSSFSFINLTNNWFFNQKLENTGKGKNYGIDISFDKYLNDGLYYSATASIFKSAYRGGDKIWRNTRFDRGYVFNFLIGKEWHLGSFKNRSFSANAQFSYQGGDWYSPTNPIQSSQEQSVVFDENNAFTKKLSPSFVMHLSFVYLINKKKNTQELALKILNAGQYAEFYDFQFNFKTQQVQQHREAIIIPNLSYKIEF